MLELRVDAGRQIGRRFVSRGQQVEGDDDELMFRTEFSNVEVPAGQIEITTWQLVCDIDTPLHRPR